MAIQANNVIEAKNLAKRRNDKAAVQSLVRLQTPPDTMRLTSCLQTTLDLEEMLGLFMHELKEHLTIDGIGLRSPGHGVVIQLGEQGRHRGNYGLSLFEEDLGEISISRNSRFSEEDLATIEHLLVPLLYPLRNGLRYRAALATAYRDPLTGVSNRAQMDETLPREVERALRHETELSMLLIDLDHFKKVNDQYGHAAGDCVLRNSAQMMRQSLRTEDRIFRFGGEEFVVLLPSTDLEGARIVAERIRESLEQNSCNCEGHSLRITASIGVAQLHGEDNHHLLFDKADKAVYRAKAEGRNRVVLNKD